MLEKFVSYLRVSTGRQGVSGLGLEAQREQVQRFVAQRGGVLVREFVEIESGKVGHRPILVQSIALCRQERATLAIAKLDRLARSVAFISALMEAGTDFVAVDMPFANKLLLHLMAAFAEHERTEIGARTKAALSAAKARGVKLGAHGRVLAENHKRQAGLFAEGLRSMVMASRSAGSRTLQQHADFLNDAGVRTVEGARFRPNTVHKILARLELSPR